MTKVLVVGSINMDIVNAVKDHPKPGETLHAFGTRYIPGGKGANQAIAAARAGAAVTFVGAVGSDAFGGQLRDGLAQAGVDVSHVSVRPGTSGLAFITVAESGENTIILSAGSNGSVMPADVDRAEVALAACDVVLLQNEIPWETTVHAMRRARALGRQVYLNLAPARELTDEEIRLVDVLVVNEVEASVASSVPVSSVAEAVDAGRRLVSRGAEAVLVTLGAQGCVWVDPAGDPAHFPAFPVQPVDTTAAGDTFIGAFAAVRGTGTAPGAGDALPLHEALRFASAAAAVKVTRPGAQTGIPSREDIERFLQAR
ncbi:ribokinase [Alicyclobacillus sp.]|uniref:ribokinase n=1 Tax=Alicyclobacillus sp. TaxID=61169 RepID=UPI0025C0AE0F|nr:ribokinase [Alicyclobacillus sp.]MCL6516265.1 ribokinase [Alicyclobacillus sp.]